MSLKIEQLTFSSPEKILFEHLDVEFSYGKLISVLGANGVGKTTFFKCLLRILEATSGTVYLDDKSIEHFSRQEIARKIAYIAQTHTPSFPYRVLDIVLMGKTPHLHQFYQTPTEKDEQVAYAILQSLDIEHLAEKNYRRLSGGERQLVMIAQAMMQDTKIIIMDEPLSSLDFGYQHKIYQVIKQMTEQGKLIIVSTHQPEHALTYSDEVLILEKDCQFHFGAPLEVMTIKVLERIYKIKISLQEVTDTKGGKHYVCVTE